MPNRHALLLVALAFDARAEIYKCTDSAGAVAFSNQPCAAEMSGGVIPVSPPSPQAKAAPAAADASDEQIERQLQVEIPATERQARRAMESGDPRQIAIGRELAWQAHLQRQAIEEIKAARAEQTKTQDRYGKALKDIQGR